MKKKICTCDVFGCLTPPRNPTQVHRRLRGSRRISQASKKQAVGWVFSETPVQFDWTPQCHIPQESAVKTSNPTKKYPTGSNRLCKWSYKVRRAATREVSRRILALVVSVQVDKMELRQLRFLLPLLIPRTAPCLCSIQQWDHSPTAERSTNFHCIPWIENIYLTR
jgi:hypothetical protein